MDLYDSYSDSSQWGEEFNFDPAKEFYKGFAEVEKQRGKK